MPARDRRLWTAPIFVYDEGTDMARQPDTSATATPTKTPAETQAIMKRLFAQHPGAFTELHFRTAFELLVATILSAQSTDKGVNEVTPTLFAKYPDARALANADLPTLEQEIKTTGFFRQKSKAITGMAKALVEQHGGEVPTRMEQLVELPGVGRKTANVVLGHALDTPALPVDRHVLRVSNRIGIAKAAEPEDVERQLCDAMPRKQWTLTSDTLILHGRRICRPHPLCEQCAIVTLCDFAREWGRTAGDATATPATSPASGKSSRTRVAASRGGRAAGKAHKQPVLRTTAKKAIKKTGRSSR